MRVQLPYAKIQQESECPNGKVKGKAVPVLQLSTTT